MTLSVRCFALRVIALVAALLVALTVLVFGSNSLPSAQAAPGVAATAKPAVPGGLPADIESLAGYVPDVSCDPSAKPGAVKLAKLLTKTYPNTHYGTSRGCGSTPNSEHYDGRAVDWMNSIRNKTQANQAKAVIAWMFAKDKDGNPYANARRLGVMYIIWDGKIWGAYSPDRGWREYAGCSSHKSRSWDTTCHRDHMHISLSWEGAMARTSFWTKKVAVRDYGPCRAADMNWAPSYKAFRGTPCNRYSKPKAPKGASTLYKTLLTYSGQSLGVGKTGPAVTAVQKAIGVSATGTFTSGTKSAVKKWQSGHGVRPSGGVGAATWRSILKAKAPH